MTSVIAHREPIAHIRRFKTEDTNAVINILNRSYYGRYYRTITEPLFVEWTRPWHHASHSYVATLGEHDNQIIGFIMAVCLDGRAHLSNFVVDPAFRNAGFGVALLEQAEDAIRDLDVSTLSLAFGAPRSLYHGVESDRIDTLNFLLKRGFQFSTRLPMIGYYIAELRGYELSDEILEVERRVRKAGHEIQIEEDDTRVAEFCFREDRAHWGKQLRTHLQRGEHTNLTVVRGGEIVGFCYFTRSERNGTYGLAYPSGSSWGPILVAAAHRRRGLGRLLVARSLSVLSQWGIPFTTLSTDLGSHRALMYQTSRFTATMSLQPTFHPDIATFRFPDFHQFHNGLTVGTLKRILAKTSFEALTPSEGVKGFDKRVKIEKRELTTDGSQGSAYLLSPFSFGVASIKASMTHQLHAFGRNMLHQQRDEI